MYLDILKNTNFASALLLTWGTRHARSRRTIKHLGVGLTHVVEVTADVASVTQCPGLGAGAVALAQVVPQLAVQHDGGEHRGGRPRRGVQGRNGAHLCIFNNESKVVILIGV